MFAAHASDLVECPYTEASVLYGSIRVSLTHVCTNPCYAERRCDVRKDTMTASRFPSSYVEQISQEVRQTPNEYLPQLLQIIRVSRESVTLKPAAESFRQDWREVVQDETQPVSELWNGIDAE